MDLRETLHRYTRFFIVAAILGVASIVALELIAFAFPYDDPVTHGMIVTAIYLVGLVVNFQFQKRWVFGVSRHVSFVPYALWMCTSALLVGLLAGVAFDLLHRYLPELPFTASISLVLALGIQSPLTFFGVSVVMREKEASP